MTLSKNNESENQVQQQDKKNIRYKENPFVGELEVPIAKRQVKVSRLGKDNNVLFNQDTGEHFGTHVTTYKRVDAEKYLKLFTANIAMTFDLKAAGIKVFNVLCWAVQENAIGKDLVVLDAMTLENFIEAHRDREPPLKLSISTFKRGLSELETAQIIAKNIRPSWYYLNPNFVFNGDRIAFTTIIERKNKEQESKNKIAKKDET